MYKKADLKPGMKVVLNNGKTYFVVSDLVMIDEHLDFRYLARYDENLMAIGDRENKKTEQWDVAKVYFYSDKIRNWKEIPPKKYITMHDDYDNVTFSVMIDGNKTTAYYRGYSGSTTCLPEDEYNEDKGIKIAFLKAKFAYLKGFSNEIWKELRELTK